MDSTHRSHHARSGRALLLAILLLVLVGGGHPSAALHAQPAGKEGLPITTTDWMGELAERIGDTPLDQLALPGAHDAGSYAIVCRGNSCPAQATDPSFPAVSTVESYLSPYVGGLLADQIGNTYAGIVLPVAASWSRTQDLTIPQQLGSGIRYLDLRTCPSPDRTQILLCHGLYGDNLAVVLQAVKGFILAHPQEVVILDFSHIDFNGIGNGTPLSQHLADEIIRTLTLRTRGDLLIPSTLSPKATLNTIWGQSGRALVLDDDATTVANNVPYLWPSYNIGRPGSDPTSPAAMFAEQQHILSCRCDPGNGGASDSEKLFGVSVNPTPDTNMIIGGILNMIEARSAFTLIPGGDGAIQLIRHKLGLVNSPNDIRDLASRAAEVGPSLLAMVSAGRVPQANLNIISSDYVEYAGIVEGTLALDAGGAVFARSGGIALGGDGHAGYSVQYGSYTIPAGVLSISIVAVGGSGASGGGYQNTASDLLPFLAHGGGGGGRGEKVGGRFLVRPGTVLSVGAAHNGADDLAGSDVPGGGGGAWGGGQGCRCGGYGGGASIVFPAASLGMIRPLLVAGGGGGGGSADAAGAGGQGGDAGVPGLVGSDGGDGHGLIHPGGGGHGGTQTGGGSEGSDPGAGSTPRGPGDFEVGGYSSGGGGGGGGYYGGGGGGGGDSIAHTGDGGGGSGSSFVAAGVALTQAAPDPAANGYDTGYPYPTNNPPGNPYVAILPDVAQAQPQVVYLSRAAGSTGGGDSVTIVGSSFTGASAIRFGDANAGSFTVVSDTQIVASSPQHTAGTLDVRVLRPGVVSPVSPADQFSYFVPPSLTQTFGPDPVTIGQVSDLTLTLTNPNTAGGVPGSATAGGLTNLGFTATLDRALTPGRVTTTCPDGRATISGQAVSLSGARLTAAGGTTPSCTVTVRGIVATSAGTWHSTVPARPDPGAFTSDQAGPSGSSSVGTLTVAATPPATATSTATGTATPVQPSATATDTATSTGTTTATSTSTPTATPSSDPGPDPGTGGTATPEAPAGLLLALGMLPLTSLAAWRRRRHADR